MRDFSLKLLVRLQLLRDDTGQDLIEYALIAGLIAFGAVAAMKTLASNIGTGFTNMGSKVNTYTS